MTVGRPNNRYEPAEASASDGASPLISVFGCETRKPQPSEGRGQDGD